jgi:hypothetical protein
LDSTAFVENSAANYVLFDLFMVLGGANKDMLTLESRNSVSDLDLDDDQNNNENDNETQEAVLGTSVGQDMVDDIAMPW